MTSTIEINKRTFQQYQLGVPPPPPPPVERGGEGIEMQFFVFLKGGGGGIAFNLFSTGLAKNN